MKARLSTASVLKQPSMRQHRDHCHGSRCSILNILWFHLLVLYSLEGSLCLSPVLSRSFVCTATGIPCVSDTSHGKDLNSSLKRQISIKWKLVQCRFLYFGNTPKIFDILSDPKVYSKWDFTALSLKIICFTLLQT